jgi:hypothetical protein
MRQSLPVVHSITTRPTAVLYVPCQRLEIQLDSDEWFAWLAQENSFKFIYHKQGGHSVNVTVRPEKRGQRTYWQAWKTIKGQTVKKYLAPSVKLKKAKLDAVGEWFFERVQSSTHPDDQSLKLYAAVADLTWLVERLIEHCANSAWVQQAQMKLEQIKQEFGN